VPVPALAQDGDDLTDLQPGGSGMQPPAADTAPAPPGPSQKGLTVGRFVVVQEHAHGGMSEVFRASDAELQRQVALKCLKAPFADHEESRQRFLREAEITAQLEHPGIVPIYGLVHDAHGRPWYAMRFIDGASLYEAIRQYHREQRGDVVAFRQLLQRFLSVCQTVAYAHSKGVIHRDLKPHNVLLGTYGETLVVDWGLARAADEPPGTEARSQAATLPASPTATTATYQGMVLGTPAYMSPEQGQGRWERVGPASDIYSLGVVLYALLTGQTPMEGQTWQQYLPQLMLGRIRPPRQLDGAVPAPLEAICLKAMALQPADRYGSALELAAEVERYLADEPVRAYREPLAERGRRWVRQHRTLVGGGLAVLVVALLCLGGATLLLGEAYKQERAAKEQEAAQRAAAEEAEKAARKAEMAAKAAQQQAEAVTRFMVEAFHNLDSSRKGSELKVVEVLDAALAGLQHDFKGDPLLRARLLEAIGQAYLGLGEAKSAVPVFEQVRQLRLSHLGPEHTDTLSSTNGLAMAYDDAGRPQEALALYEQTLKLRQQKLGADHADTLQSMNNLANAYLAAGRREEALALYEQTLQLRQQKLGAAHPDTLQSMHNLAHGYYSADRMQEALALYEKTLALRKQKLGADHPETLNTMSNLAGAYVAAGRFEDAVALGEAALKLRQQKLGIDHPDILQSMNNLAIAYHATGRFFDAMALHEQTLKQRQRKLGADHPDTLQSMNNLAFAYFQAWRFADAEVLLAVWLAKQRPKLLADDTSVAHHLKVLGECQVRQRKFAEAESNLRDSLNIYRKQQPQSAPRYDAEGLLGAALTGQRRFAAAEAVLLAAYERLKMQQSSLKGTRKVPLWTVLKRVVDLYEAWGRHDEAVKWRAMFDGTVPAARAPRRSAA
jgi:tetratricopeptide (TPR) repeat protein/tRNA A-37 threonylcarbamoyl transferase component Bud32